MTVNPTRSAGGLAMPSVVMTTPPDNDIAFVDDDTGSQSGGIGAHRHNELAMALGPLLERPGGLRDGALFILSLRSFREHLGERWPKAAGKVYEAIDHLIGEEITGYDTFTRFGSDRYLIAFGRASGEGAAAVKVAVIANRIKEKLFGEASALEVEIVALGDNATKPQSAGKPALKVPAPKAETAEYRPLPADNGKISYTFLPIWDAFHKILSTYSCMPMRTLRSGRTRMGHELLPDANEMERAEFDRNTFQYVAETAHELALNRFAVLLTFGVHYESLASSRSRDLLVSAFRRLPKELRNFINVQIVEAPASVPTLTLTERVGALKPYFRSVMLHVDSLDQDVGRFAYTGLHGLVYKLGDHDLNIERQKPLIKRIRGARLQLGVGRITDIHLADQLAEAGVTYLSGPFLGEALDTPRNMCRMTLEDLGRPRPVKPAMPGVVTI